MTDPRDRIKKMCLKKIGGYPRVDKRERKSQDKDVIKGMVDEIGKGRSKRISRAAKEGAKPFRE